MIKIKTYIFTILLMTIVSQTKVFAQYDHDVFMFRGRLALSDGRFSQAIEHFNILSKLDSTDYWTFFYRGIAKYNLGDIRGAQNDFDNSIRLNPVFTSAYHYRAITFSRFNKYDESLKDLETAIDLRPGYMGLYFTRGVTYFLSQQFEKAVEDFDRYIRKEPKDPSPYLNRGACYLYLGDTLKAVRDYNKAIKLDRFDPEAYVRRGRLYASQNDYKAAISDMDKAIKLDTTNTFAYFNRAIMFYEQKNYIAAMKDLNRVLEDEPGNALTLYNRGLINAQVGDFRQALSDMDRVLNINPENVLAYFNRASIFIEMDRYEDALEDYDTAIKLYPDFAKAYMNRSYVKNILGDKKSSKEDYDIAQQKVAEYRKKAKSDSTSLADTTQRYDNLLALDADFAKKDFNDELLQHRDIDIRLRPLYKFVLAQNADETVYALRNSYENPLISHFEEQVSKYLNNIGQNGLGLLVSNKDPLNTYDNQKLELALHSDTSGDVNNNFMKALYECDNKQFNSALTYFDKTLAGDEDNQLSNLFKAFYYMNRAVLRAEVIDFISSIESNVQVLTMDDKGTTRARVKNRVEKKYDYSDAIADLTNASKIVGDIPYIYFNLGNLYCLSAEHLLSIENYTKAINIYPFMGDAYYNRGLVLIYLKDKEKGCIDLSRAGELGVSEAYSVIKKYCEKQN